MAPLGQPPPPWDTAAAACVLGKVVEALINELHHRTASLALALALLLPADPEEESLLSALKPPWCLWDGLSCQKTDIQGRVYLVDLVVEYPHRCNRDQISLLHLFVCFEGEQRFVQAV